MAARKVGQKRAEDIPVVVKDGVVKAYEGPITDLPVRHQTIYRKRFEWSRIFHALDPVSADVDARIFVARSIYREVERKREKARQLRLFAVKGGSSMTPDQVGGVR